MGHNWVLLKAGTDMETFSKKAAMAKDRGYIPKNEISSIIAYTKLLGGGESDTIAFTIKKGTYEFLCSFPTHYSAMQGKLIIE